MPCPQLMLTPSCSNCLSIGPPTGNQVFHTTIISKSWHSILTLQMAGVIFKSLHSIPTHPTNSWCLSHNANAPRPIKVLTIPNITAQKPKFNVFSETQGQFLAKSLCKVNNKVTYFNVQWQDRVQTPTPKGRNREIARGAGEMA